MGATPDNTNGSVSIGLYFDTTPSHTHHAVIGVRVD